MMNQTSQTTFFVFSSPPPVLPLSSLSVGGGIVGEKWRYVSMQNTHLLSMILAFPCPPFPPFFFLFVFLFSFLQEGLFSPGYGARGWGWG